jgi:hypothetical protein
LPHDACLFASAIEHVPGEAQNSKVAAERVLGEDVLFVEFGSHLEFFEKLFG